MPIIGVPARRTMPRLDRRRGGRKVTAVAQLLVITVSDVPFGEVESGRVQPEQVDPIPPREPGYWCHFTTAMNGRCYTCVQSWDGRWFLGWIWQRIPLEPAS
jgi:hypothetical protein